MRTAIGFEDQEDWATKHVLTKVAEYTGRDQSSLSQMTSLADLEMCGGQMWFALDCEVDLETIDEEEAATLGDWIQIVRKQLG